MNIDFDNKQLYNGKKISKLCGIKWRRTEKQPKGWDRAYKWYREDMKEHYFRKSENNQIKPFQSNKHR